MPIAGSSHANGLLPNAKQVILAEYHLTNCAQRFIILREAMLKLHELARPIGEAMIPSINARA